MFITELKPGRAPAEALEIETWKHQIRRVGQELPSGKRTFAIEICPFIFDLPIKDGDFP